MVNWLIFFIFKDNKAKIQGSINSFECNKNKQSRISYKQKKISEYAKKSCIRYKIFSVSLLL